MKYLFVLSILAVLLGGCVLVPAAGYGDNRGGYYYQDHRYNQDDGNFRGYGNRGPGY